MNYVEISDLLSKGFTSDQIMLLVSSSGGDPEPSPEMKALRDEMKAEMKALKEAIQAQNIITQHIDNIPPSSESTESILAGIIRPPFENKKD